MPTNDPMKLNAYKETKPKMNFFKIQNIVFMRGDLRTLNVCYCFKNHDFVGAKV